MNKWIVYTPSYFYYEYSIDYGEWQCDVVQVTGDNKKEALVNGVRQLRIERSKWINDYANNPFTKLKAEVI